MARKIRAKLVLKLRAAGHSRRSIARTQGMSKRSVIDVFDAADKLGIGYDDVADSSDEEVYALLFPGRNVHEDVYAEPDWEHVHRELARTGVTLKLLHAEYVDQCSTDKTVAMGYDRFCKRYRAFTVASNVTSRVGHKAGRIVEVDWSGSTMAVVDPATGEVQTVYLFVACLPFSRYTYVEPTLDMKQDTWLRCHVRMFEFLGGSTPCIVSDNLKCAAAHLRFNGGSRVMRSPGAKRLVRSQRTPHYILVSVGSPKSEEECHDRRKKGLPQSQVQHRGVQQQQVQGLRPSHGRRA